MANRLGAIPLVLLAVLSATAWADPPATEPDKIWNLPGLTGTAAQIKIELHKELDELNGKIAAAQGDLRSAQAEMQKHRDVVAAQLAKEDSTYQYVCKTITASQQELATTKSASRADELRIKIAGFTKRANAMIDLAVAKNADTPRFVAEENEKNARLDRLKNDLAKCIDWRCQLGAAVRGGMSLQWPAPVGSTGIIGRLQITNIDPSGAVTAEGEIFKPMAQDPGSTEGIVTVRGRGIPTTFVITGWNDDGLAAGQSVFFDKTIRVDASQPSEGRLFVRAERLPSDEDAILDDFREFRKPDEGNLSDR